MTDAAQCPLCNGPNACQLCSTAAYKGPCWCAKMTIPETLLARVPLALRNKACICRTCVTSFHQAAGKITECLPGDFYFEAGGSMVFTAAYHQRRGYCCGNGCRHCPY